MYGKISEQFLPFLESYPYDSSKFRFLGTPIDGVQFEEDKVVFVEFKTANSKLSQRQRHIKELVEQKKVEFVEYNLKEK
jgi:predicted Holliday junction resolvase-like endonuclease